MPNALLPTKDFVIDWKRSSVSIRKNVATLFRWQLDQRPWFAWKAFRTYMQPPDAAPDSWSCYVIRWLESARKWSFPRTSGAIWLKVFAKVNLTLRTKCWILIIRCIPKLVEFSMLWPAFHQFFEGKEYDKRAPYTASEWPSGKYLPPLIFGNSSRIRYCWPDSSSWSENGHCERRLWVFRKRSFRADDFGRMCHSPNVLQPAEDLHQPELKVYPFPDNPDFTDVFTDPWV